MDKYRALSQAARARQGEPRERSHDRDELLAFYPAGNQNVIIKALRKMQFSYVLDNPYPPCLRPHAELVKIYLKGLKAQTHHTDSMLLVRTFGHPRKLSPSDPACNAIEDETGDVEDLLVSFTGPGCDATVLAKGSVLLIKEPFFDVSNAVNRVSVNHPSNLVFLDHDHASVPHDWQLTSVRSALEWMSDGDEALLEKKRYSEAIRCYGRGLSTTGTTDGELKEDLHRKRSVAALHVGYYDLAKEDALDSLSGSDSKDAKKLNLRSLYQAGLASSRLGEFATAQQLFCRVLEISPSFNLAIRQLGHAGARLLEEQTGVYDFDAMFASAEELSPDYGNFLKRTEIRSSSISGRGLFAAEDISRGEIVLCEKAFASDKHSGDIKPGGLLDLHNNRAYGGSYTVLLNNAVQKIFGNPSLFRILNLFSDDCFKVLKSLPIVDGLPAVDIFRVNSILQHNMFDYAEPRDKFDVDQGKHFGLWYQASHINHSCLANSHRSFNGDMMLIRAGTNISRGSEITLAYSGISAFSSEQQEEYQRDWGFRCGCKKCTSEQHTTPDSETYKKLKAAMKIWIDYRTNAKPVHEIISQAQEAIDDIMPLYHEHEKLPRLGLTQHRAELMWIYHDMKRYDLVAETAVHLIRDYGYILSFDGQGIHLDSENGILDLDVVWALLLLFTGNSVKGNDALSKAYKQLVVETYTILKGTIIGIEGLLSVPL
ncbi:SET domain-containing protein [Aureobasidium subglaciale]|nr:SET domain-containing protein [Aureobasidium subglaciale]